MRVRVRIVYHREFLRPCDFARRTMSSTVMCTAAGAADVVAAAVVAAAAATTTAAAAAATTAAAVLPSRRCVRSRTLGERHHARVWPF